MDIMNDRTENWWQARKVTDSDHWVRYFWLWHPIRNSFHDVIDFSATNSPSREWHSLNCAPDDDRRSFSSFHTGHTFVHTVVCDITIKSSGVKLWTSISRAFEV